MKATKKQEKRYSKLVQAKSPPRPIAKNLVMAFLTGGTICAVAQIILGKLMGAGLPQKDSLALTSASMVFLGSLLTGLGVYDELGRVGGMGSALPITGFANSIVSSAMEFKREGFVLGVSAKMFTIAGPVVVFGVVSSVAVALVKALLARG